MKRTLSLSKLAYFSLGLNVVRNTLKNKSLLLFLHFNSELLHIVSNCGKRDRRYDLKPLNKINTECTCYTTCVM